MERETKLSADDAIANAEGTVHSSVWESLEDEGWNIDQKAERIT